MPASAACDVCDADSAVALLPVCADGVREYANPCSAHCAGETVVAFGACTAPVEHAGDEETHNGSHHEVHPHFALTFLIVALSLGALCHQFKSKLVFPYTVLLLLLGMGLGAIHSLTGEKLGSLSDSISMWTKIDPHLLLFVFLPALLFGDAINLNLHTLKRCIWQILLLAGPGVALGSFLCALAPRYVFGYDWSWNYSMLLGSMLAATDPVAVVGLLKELGASRKLSTIISGESMVNDGTAVVFYLLFLDLAQGKSYTALETIEFFAQMAIAGPAIGAAIAFVGLFWIMAGKDSVIEATVFFLVAYAGMVCAEQEGGASGVLSVVGAGTVMATYAWPYIDDIHSLHNVWEWLEWMGNTLIFFLAGTILGVTFCESSNISAGDWLLLLLNYAAVNVARGVVIAVFFPVLRLLGYGLSPAEAAFMAFGGLRGAVGVAMAIAVAHTAQFEGADGERMLFHVGGIAALTLIINGSLGGIVLESLGLLRKTAAQETCVRDVRHKVAEAVAERHQALVQKPMFRHHRPHVLQHLVSKVRATVYKAVESHELVEVAAAKEVIKAKQKRWSIFSLVSGGGGEEATAAATAVAASRSRLSFSKRALREADPDVLACLRQLFLSTLVGEYWHMVHTQELPQEDCNALLHSTEAAKDDAELRLAEWERLEEQLAPGRMARLLGGGGGVERGKVARTTTVLVFVEAHRRASRTTFDTFGEGEGADSPEELELEREIQAVVDAAERYLGEQLCVTEEELAKLSTEHLTMLLKTDMQAVIDKMVAQGVIAPADGAAIFSDVKAGLEATSATQGNLRRLLSRTASIGSRDNLVDLLALSDSPDSPAAAAPADAAHVALHLPPTAESTAPSRSSIDGFSRRIESHPTFR